ncbi:hypothetical protein, partial [Salmonella enterica]|uniref:hypothetical protein n=1 Tax=Salmonella enterica TaxID=28901 RepID=UPI001A9CA526
MLYLLSLAYGCPYLSGFFPGNDSAVQKHMQWKILCTKKTLMILLLIAQTYQVQCLSAIVR